MAEEDINDLLERTCVGEGNGPFENYKGCFLAEIYKNSAEEIDNLQVNDSDVWVTSFPKCGTTWLQEMVYLISTNCDYESAKVYLTQRFPFLELGTLFNHDLYPSKDMTVNGFEKFRANSIKYVKQLKDTPRLIKSHLPYFLLPKSIQTNDKRPKILHVTRNPKDVCVSYYNHSIRYDTFKGDFQEYCKLFLADKVLYTPFWDTVLSYWNRKDDPNVLFLKYEDMKADLRSVILKVAAFLDKTLTEDQIEKLLVHLDFDSMKDNMAVNYELIKSSSIKHMRKGIVGDYKNVMSNETIKEFDEWISKNDPGLYVDN